MNGPIWWGRLNWTELIVRSRMCAVESVCVFFVGFCNSGCVVHSFNRQNESFYGFFFLYGCPFGSRFNSDTNLILLTWKSWFTQILVPLQTKFEWKKWSYPFATGLAWRILGNTKWDRRHLWRRMNDRAYLAVSNIGQILYIIVMKSFLTTDAR